MRRLEDVPQLAVVDLAEPAPRRDARLPQRLGLPQVADARHEPLVQEGVPDLAHGLGTQPRVHRLVIGRLAEDVGADASHVTVCYKLEDSTVPEHGLVFAAPQHEPRLAGACRSARLDAPAAVHPQMAAEDEPALEPQEEVLPHRLDLLQPPPVEPLRQPLDRRARMRRLDLHPLADENLEPPSRPMQRIAFRHRGKPTIQA